MPRRYTGDLSRASIAAMDYALMLQGMTLDSIKKAFSSETDEIDIHEMTVGDFIRGMVEADAAGTRNVFDAQLAAQLGPIIKQVLGSQGDQRVPQGEQQ